MKTSETTKLPTTPVDSSVSTDGFWTIDSTSGAGNNGFLDCARSGHPGAGGHGSTQESVDNLLNFLPETLSTASGSVAPATANFVGHGNDGLIVTGTGQYTPDPLKYIASSNRNSWQDELQRLSGSASIIRLWACHPGTGQDGLSLLDFVCQETEAITMGLTGFLYCNGGNFSLEPNSTWQVVTPGQPLPSPIAAPSAHFTATFSEMKITNGKEYEDVAIEDVTSIEILTADGSRKLQELTSSSDSVNFIRVFDFDSPFIIEGVPAAIVTARVRVHFSSSATRLVGATREFIVWNDRQLEDVDHQGHFYNAQPELHDLLRTMQ